MFNQFSQTILKITLTLTKENGEIFIFDGKKSPTLLKSWWIRQGIVREIKRDWIFIRNKLETRWF